MHAASHCLVRRVRSFELGTAEQPMLLRAVINITDEGARLNVPHLGTRFFAADGLASCAPAHRTSLSPIYPPWAHSAAHCSCSPFLITALQESIGSTV